MPHVKIIILERFNKLFYRSHNLKVVEDILVH